jgi:type IV secretion system protein VirD4
MSKGISIGRINDWRTPSLWRSAFNLLNPRVPSGEACERFMAAVLKRPVQSMAEVRLTRSPHSLFCGPTAAGKTTMVAVPFLKSSSESAVIVDYDGVIAKATANYRAQHFGHACYFLDPLKAFTYEPVSLNPLSLVVRGSELAVDHCRDLACALTVRPPEEREQHFLDGAEFMLSMATLSVVEIGMEGDRSLETVRRVLASPAMYEKMIEMAAESEAYDGILATMAGQMRHFVDRELGSTLTTVNRLLRWIDSPAVHKSVGTTSFDIGELRTGKATIYLILPLQHSRVLAPLMRVWLTTLLRVCIEGGPLE